MLEINCECKYIDLEIKKPIKTLAFNCIKNQIDPYKNKSWREWNDIKQENLKIRDIPFISDLVKLRRKSRNFGKGCLESLQIAISRHKENCKN